jgi:hypothetical protein
MSKIFYDHLIAFKEIDLEIKRSTQSFDEKEEMWKLVDEVVHHHVMISILERLPDKHHDSFLQKFHSRPHDNKLIGYLNKKTGEDIEKAIRDMMRLLEKEILKELRSK